ncbi:MAG: ABC transporter ATP-binding protein [Phycisphaerales bacterium]|nr:MAG: ABC transporter ATP-binding protein [Phycisphaerales bacterium]
MVVLEGVSKSYPTAQGKVEALHEVTLSMEKGEFVVLCGPSGSGKTTLLMTVAAMLHPTTGSVTVGQRNLYQMSSRARAKFRAERIGFIFQMFHLVPYLNVVENVVLGAQAAGRSGGSVQARQLLERLGLDGRAHHRPSQLSAGEKQRTAIARALFNRPKIILADEPTGNLDGDNATSVLGHLSDFHRNGGTVVLATHGERAEQYADRVVYMSEGEVRS